MGPRARARGIPCPSGGSKTFWVASMGPRARARGIALGYDDVVEEYELQWGHALARVESHKLRLLYQDSIQLQWGHALARVESPPFARVAAVVDEASMGPRARARGITGADAVANGATVTLQWGHALARVESS